MAAPDDKNSERVEQQPPYALAMIICDNIHIDPTTGKKTLLGIFSNVVAPSFPVNIAHFMLYAVLTDGHGKTPIRIKLVDADELRPPIFEAENQVVFPDPRSIADVVFGAVNAEFPEQGEYRLQLFACGSLLMERRIVCVTPPEAPPDA